MAVLKASSAQRHLTELTFEFLATLELERGLSRNTLEAYRSDLQQFGLFLGRIDRDPLVVGPAELAAFVTELATGPRGQAAGRARHSAAQDRLPEVLLPPPAPRADHRSRSDRGAAAAPLAEPVAEGAQPR